MFHLRQITGHRTGHCLRKGATIGCHRALTKDRSNPPTQSSCTGMMPVSEHCEALTQDPSCHDEAEGQPAPVGRVDVSQDGLHARQDQGEAGSVQARESCSLRCSTARHPCQPRRTRLASVVLLA